MYTFTFDTDLDERLIHTDPAAFERIIFNLLSNAIKYTAPGGQLYITVSDLGERDVFLFHIVIGCFTERFNSIYNIKNLGRELKHIIIEFS